MVSTTTNYIGSTVTISYNTTNNGPGVIDMANGPGADSTLNCDLVYLYKPLLWMRDAVQIAQISVNARILMWAVSATATYSVNVPTVTNGSDYLILSVDAIGFSGIGARWEANDSNNIVSIPVCRSSSPTSECTNLTAPASVSTFRGPMQVQYIEVNEGNAAPFNPYYGIFFPYIWYDQIFVSPTNILDGSRAGVAFNPSTNALAAG